VSDPLTVRGQSSGCSPDMRRNTLYQTRHARRHQKHTRRGTPTWYDTDNTRECDHDREEFAGEVIREETRYSGFGYYMERCTHPDCDETYCTYIEG